MSKQRVLAIGYLLADYREVEPWLPDDAKERLERELRATPPSLETLE
jgi:hypothetical protein